MSKLKEYTKEEIYAERDRIKEEFKDKGWDDTLYNSYTLSADSIEEALMKLLNRTEIYSSSSASFEPSVSTLTSIGVPASFVGMVKDPHPTVTALFNSVSDPMIRGEVAGLVYTEEDPEVIEAKAQKIAKREKVKLKPRFRVFQITLTPVNT